MLVDYEATDLVGSTTSDLKIAFEAFNTNLSPTTQSLFTAIVERFPLHLRTVACVKGI